MLTEQTVLKTKDNPEFGALHAAKFALELGPLGIFFGTNYFLGIFYATASLMATTIISLAVSKLLLKRIPTLALVTGVCVMVFGFLTIWLQDDTFIKIKPTVVNSLFASTLAAGLILKRNFLKIALGEVLALTDDGWRLLTLRWIGFFIALAVLNEIVWRNFTTPTWAGFKLGIMPLTFLFMIAQLSLIMKYQEPDAEQPAA